MTDELTETTDDELTADDVQPVVLPPAYVSEVASVVAPKGFRKVNHAYRRVTL